MQLSTKSGTSSLRAHTAEYCAKIDESTRKLFAGTMKKQTVQNFVFDPKLSRERMIDYAIHAEIRFNKFEDPYFEPWMESLQPTFNCVGRQTIRNECFNKFEKLKKELQNELSNLDSHVCLTSDMWTSVQNLGYMVITAHYINAEFKLKKKIICFKHVKYPHTGFAIEEAIVSCLTEWGIRDMLFTLTVDNASNNTSACEELVRSHKRQLMLEGVHLHVRCCAHILNILVQDGMKLIHGAIDKIRELLKHIDSSPSRIQAFNTIANANGLPPKRGISLDIPNRWNSTLGMIGEALKYKAVLNSYASQNGEVSPTEEEWSRTEALCEFLKAFEEATNVVSADRKPTAHVFLPLVLSIRCALNDPGWQTNEVLKELAATMKIKFQKYWGSTEFEMSNPNRKKKDYDFNMTIVIATLLDPRRKGDYLEFFYEKICLNRDQVETCTNLATECMKKYFREYDRRLRRATSYLVTYSRGSSSTVGSPVLGKRELEEKFSSFTTR